MRVVQDLKAKSFKGMTLADNGDGLRNVFGMGSVWRFPSTA